MDWGIKLWLSGQDGQHMFGEGPLKLLEGVEQHGSLKRATEAMGMAYSKALQLIGRAERELGFALLLRETGGRNGGGSSLTSEAHAFLERYHRFEGRVTREVDRLFGEIFEEQREKVHDPALEK